MAEKKRSSSFPDIRGEAERRVGPIEMDEDIPPEKLKELVHELQVHQVELEIQNEELCRIQMEVAESRQEYFDLFHHAPVGYVLINAAGIVQELNNTLCRLTGARHDAIIGKPFFKNIAEEDRPLFLARFNAVFKHPEDKQIACRLRTENGFVPVIITAESRSFAGHDEASLMLTITDVSPLRKEQEALAEREQELEQFFDHMAAGVAIYDPVGDAEDFLFADMNHSGLRHIGLLKEELVGKKLTDVFPGVREMGLFDVLQRVSRTGRPEEIPLTRYHDDRIEQWVENYVFRLPSGQVVAMFNDVTDRKRAEIKLAEADLRQRQAVEAGHIGLWDWDLTTNTVHFSAEWKKQIGYEDHEISDDFDEWRSRVHPDELEMVETLIQNFIKEKQAAYKVKFRFLHKDGSWRWILAQAAILYDAAGKPSRVLGSHVDVTDQHESEAALRESEEKFSKAFFGSPLMMAISDFETGRFIEANDTYLRITGWSREEMIGKTSIELGLLSPEGRESLIDDLRKNERIDGIELETRSKTGRWIVCEYYAEIIHVAGQKRLFSVAVDITDRKQMEQQLQEGRERLGLALDGARLGSWDWEVQTGKVVFDERWAQMLGYELDEIEPNLSSWEKLTHPDDMSAAMEKRTAHLEDRTPEYEAEMRMRHKSGKWVWILDRGRVIERDADGKPLRACGTHMDITERKKNQAVLAQRTNLLQASARIAHILFRPEDVDISIQSALTELGMASGQDRVYLFEYHRDEVSGENLMSQRYEWVAQGVSAQLHNPDLQGLSFERYFMRWFKLLRDGSCVCGSVHTFPEEEQALLIPQDIVSLLAVPLQIDGKFWGFIGLDNCRVEYPWSDVEISVLSGVANLIGVSIVRRRMVEQIEAHKARLTVATKSAGIGIWDRDVVNDVLIWDERMFEIYGLKPEDFSGAVAAWQKGMHPDDRERAVAEVAAAERGEKPFDTEFRIVRPDGEIRYIKAHADVLRDEDGNALRMIGTNQDITERREAEQRLRFIVESSTNLFYTHTTDHVLTYLSPQVKTILGYEPEEAMVRWTEMATDNPINEAGFELTQKAIQTGEAQLAYELELRHKDGHPVWVEVREAPVVENGEVIGIAGSLTDITARKKTDKELWTQRARYRELAQHLESVREEERKHLSRELHDDIGQILTALKIDLALLQDQCDFGPDQAEGRLNDMQSLLTEGIGSVHSLCRNLRPGALDDLGLGEALEGLVDAWSRRNTLDCELTVDLNDQELSDEVNTVVFRMVQEALTNVSRYAQATHVDVMLKTTDRTLVCSVIDDGVGLEPGAENKPTSFGLMGMRERVEAVGGTLSIRGEKGNGTRLEAQIPLEP